MKKKEKRNKIVLNNKQMAAYHYLTNTNYNKITSVGFGGSVGSGKSFVASLWLTDMCLDKDNPGLRYAACAYDIEKSKDTILHTLRTVFGLKGLVEDVHWKYYKNDKEIVFLETQSSIHLFGLPTKKYDPTNEWLRGYEFTGAWIDESDTISYNVIKTFYTRIGRVNNKVKIPAEDMTDKEREENPYWKEDDGYYKVLVPIKIFETFNPNQGHTFERFYMPYKRNEEGTTRFVRTYMKDAYSERDPYYQSLKNMPEGPEKDRMFYGSFEYNASENALFNYNDIEKMWQTTNPSRSLIPVMSAVVDVAGIGKAKNDKTTISVWEDLHCTYTREVKNVATTEGLIFEIKKTLAMYNVPIQNLVIDANGIGAMIATSAELKGCKSFMAHGSVVKENIGSTNTFKRGTNVMEETKQGRFHRLKDQCTYLLSEYISNGDISINATPSVREEIKRELIIYEGAESSSGVMRVTSKDKIRDLLGRSPDFSDLLVMRMYLELIKTKVNTSIPLSERKFINKKKKRKTYV